MVAKSTLTRPRNRMPAAVRTELVEQDLLAAYRARPAYQRNDYLGWIARAKRPETRAKRLGIMLRELKAGSGYMTLPYHAKGSARDVKQRNQGHGGTHA
jgi:hypothetical protein